MTTMTTGPLAIARPPSTMAASGQSSIIHPRRRQALVHKLRALPPISTVTLLRPRASYPLPRSLAAGPSSLSLEDGEEEEEEEEEEEDEEEGAEGGRVGVVAEGKEVDVDERKPRLKPFWFFLSILKKWSPSAAWMDGAWFRPSKKLGISIFVGCVLALVCSFLKVTATESPQVVPYSNLVEHLQEGKVEAALFEEGSRHILFNLRALDGEPNLPEEAAIPLEEAASISPEMAADASKVTTISPQMFAHAPKESLFAPNVGTVAPQIALISGPRARILALIKRTPPAKLLAAKKRPSKQWQFSTRRIKNDESYLLGLMRGQRISYSSAPQPMSAALRTVLITIISLWIPLTPLLWLMHRQLSGGYGSQKKRLSPQSVKFEDVAGVDEAKNELMEVVSCLRGATKFKRLGATLPKGVLLVGPPGTGKTLLARAVAGEAGVPFLAVSASEFVEMFVGRGAARVRELFATARKNSPSIVFIDELDAVGGHRGRSFNDERDQTLNQLLTEMDGFESDSGVLVIAATNRAEALDAALCRPGRFSRKVYVKQPDADGRRKILAVHMRGIPVQGSRDAICDAVSRNTDGFVGADLANLVNEAAFLAARRESSAVSVEDFKEAIGRVKYGVGSKSGVGGGLGRVEREISRWFGRQSSNTPPNEQSLLGYQAASWSG